MGTHNRPNRTKHSANTKKKKPKIIDNLDAQIVVLGESCVGKSSIIEAFLNPLRPFDPDLLPTVICNFYTHQTNFLDKCYDYSLNLGSDQEMRGDNILSGEIVEITRTAPKPQKTRFVKSGNGFVLVFDLHNKRSLGYCRTAYKAILKLNSFIPRPVVLMGSKADLPMQVSESDIDQLKKDFNCVYFQCSAKAPGPSIKDAFTELAHQIFKSTVRVIAPGGTLLSRHNLVKAGTLKKKKKGKNWKTRYCVLTESSMRYYTKEPETDVNQYLKGTIIFQLAKAAIDPKNSKKFIVTVPETEYYFIASNPTQAKEWVEAFELGFANFSTQKLPPGMDLVPTTMLESDGSQINPLGPGEAGSETFSSMKTFSNTNRLESVSTSGSTPPDPSLYSSSVSQLSHKSTDSSVSSTSESSTSITPRSSTSSNSNPSVERGSSLPLRTDSPTSSSSSFGSGKSPKSGTSEATHVFREFTTSEMESITQEYAYSEAAKRFNTKPRLGVEFLMSTPLANTPDDIARFMFDCSALSKKKIGLYIASTAEFNLNVLDKFISIFPVKNLRLDDALRVLLKGFVLAGEAQIVDRIMETFSKSYNDQNPNIFTDPLSAYLTSFSLIMLNTDLHNPSVKVKMSLSKFIQRMKDAFQGLQDEVDVRMMELMYKSISESEFEFVGEREDISTPDAVGWAFISFPQTKKAPKFGFKTRSKAYDKAYIIIKDSVLYAFRKPGEPSPHLILPLENIAVKQAPVDECPTMPPTSMAHSKYQKRQKKLQSSQFVQLKPTNTPAWTILEISGKLKGASKGISYNLSEILLGFDFFEDFEEFQFAFKSNAKLAPDYTALMKNATVRKR